MKNGKAPTKGTEEDDEGSWICAGGVALVKNLPDSLEVKGAGYL